MEDTDDRSHLPSKGGSGDEQGSSNPPPGQTGGGGGQATSGVLSVTSSPNLIGDGGGGKAAEEGLAVKSKYGLLILEDAEDADATTRDELIMLAGDNPMWKEELIRYMKEEQKEKERIQNECAARLARWREDMAVELTS